MIDTLNSAINVYKTKWESLLQGRADKSFFAALQPTAVAWKTVDRNEYDQLLAELHDLCDTIAESYWDGRWLATLHLKDQKLADNIEVIKIMQRRPGSQDAPGLDHIDFYSTEVKDADQILQKETDLHWTHETSGPCKWISVWFAGTEAKLRTHTVIDSCIRDLELHNTKIKGNLAL